MSEKKTNYEMSSNIANSLVRLRLLYLKKYALLLRTSKLYGWNWRHHLFSLLMLAPNFSATKDA